MKIQSLLIIILSVLLINSCDKKQEQLQEPPMSDEAKIVAERIKAYSPVEIVTDLSVLSDREKILVEKLVEAGKLADKIFWYQCSPDGVQVRDSLLALKTEESKVLLEYVMINFGAYDPLFENQRFVGKGPLDRPKGGGFYPANITKEEFDAYLTKFPEQAEGLKGQYTIVERDGANFKATPYHQYYKESMQLADLLDSAAVYADDPAFKKYLTLRAKAIRTDDYYESDLAWMDVMGSKFDIVIGPIENYQDEMYNYKSAHEAMIMVQDEEATADLQFFKDNMRNFENNLPFDNKYKNKEFKEGNIIQVVNVVYFGGDCQQGVKTIAAALPNDPKVADAKGRKLSMFKNHMEAKFDKIVAKIGKKLLSPEYAKYVDKKSFTTFVTLHEVSHALGPKYVYGKKEEVRLALKDRYSAIEECKADILSMYNHKYLNSIGVYNDEDIMKAMATYIAGLYRSVRFGTGAHFNANLIQLNYLREAKVFTTNESGTFDINKDIFFNKVADLAKMILMIQAEGNYEKAGEILTKYANIPDVLQKEIESLTDIPRDIDTKYTFKK